MPFQSSYPINTGSRQRPISPGGGGRVFPIMTYHGKVNPERSTFSGFRYTKERVGISLVEEYERGGKSVISVGRKTQKSSHEFYGSDKVDESVLLL